MKGVVLPKLIHRGGNNDLKPPTKLNTKSPTTMKQQNYSKTFIPLESDPQVFTDLAHQLGLADSVVFKELFSLQEHIDGQILAYILIFPTTPSYDAERAAENNGTSAVKPDVVFLKQTIHNACGLYAMLHAACNGRAQSFISTADS